MRCTTLAPTLSPSFEVFDQCIADKLDGFLSEYAEEYGKYTSAAELIRLSHEGATLPVSHRVLHLHHNLR